MQEKKDDSANAVSVTDVISGKCIEETRSKTKEDLLLNLFATV